MFELIKRSLIEAQEAAKKERAEYIKQGYLNKWAEYNRKPGDNGIERYSTATRWQQFQNGEITRDQAVNYAIKREYKRIDKETAAKLEHLDRVAAAPDCSYINISVWRVYSRTWGSNPHCNAWNDAEPGETYGTASGCGYDKESAAIAQALNASPAVLKVLYTIKEKALEEGAIDFSATACTYRNNTECCGYGAGYSAIPYFEGGVGSSCFWEILKKAGFECSATYGKREAFYKISKI